MYGGTIESMELARGNPIGKVRLIVTSAVGTVDFPPCRPVHWTIKNKLLVRDETS